MNILIFIILLLSPVYTIAKDIGSTESFNNGIESFKQKNYEEALHSYQTAREQFEQLGEPSSIASVWHQTAMVYEQTGNFEAADSAYRESLAIETRQKNQKGDGYRCC